MLDFIKIFLPTTLAFLIGIAITPLATSFMYHFKLWKKSARAGDDKPAIFNKIHNTDEEIRTPRVGGVIIWGSIVIAMGILFIIAKIIPSPLSSKLEFVSRNQTLIPLAALVFGSLLGLIDDLLQVFNVGSYSRDHIQYRRVKVVAVILIGLVLGSWFYFKLGMTGITVPFFGMISLGYLFIPFFILVLLATFSTSVIDGIDGLAGGVLATVFAAYTGIAFFQNQIDIAAFSGVITGATLAFLWFNVPPARFYMGETGMLGLTVVLTVIAFLTDSVLVLPIIALPLVATSLSVIIQISYYKATGGKRLFKLSPLHHHFEALGWSRPKITMRYWIVSIMSAIIGIIIAVIGI